jgi:NAD(P)H-hydrate epimerase
VVDALLGTGAQGAPRGILAEACAAIARLRTQGARVVAVDLPTGVSSDDGSEWPGAVQADLTVTFGQPRLGHHLQPGRSRCGVVEVVDIGLVSPEAAGLRPVELADAATLASLVPVRDPRAHKGRTGRALLVGGAPGMTGAVVLAARGALRAGAGYVRVAVPANVADVVASHLVEAMVLGCGDAARAALGEDAHARIVAESASAGALHALAPATPALVEALRHAPAPRVLTPHVGEMAALTGASAAAIEARRVEAAREAAVAWGACVVLKGAPTVVAMPDGRVSVNPTGGPVLATAGTGDVLCGALVALLAQGLGPWDAARLAVHAHGLAGDLAAREIGGLGVLASEVADRLPAALRAIADARP